MTQLTLDAAEGQRLKREGLAQVEGDAEFLAIMRSYAKMACSVHGSVTTDQLRIQAEHIGLTPRSSHSWGAIFHGKGWTVVGRQPSKLASNHGRSIAVWRWEGV